MSLTSNHMFPRVANFTRPHAITYTKSLISLHVVLVVTFFIAEKESIFLYSGTAGDSFSSHRGAPFSTKDRDNDADSRHCAVTFKGGWWYIACRNANLNGLYHHGPHKSHADGINWQHWKGDYYSAKRSEMKIRPADF